MGRYAVPEHFSTHLDAPIHGGDNQPSVDELTADDLFGPGVLIDVSSEAEDPDYALTRDDIEAWEAVNGRIPEGAVVLMCSGWASRWMNPPSYRNADGDGMHFPGFGADAARFLVEERSIRGIGVDTPSVDPAQADGFPVHGIVNGSGYYQLENLAIPPGLPPSGFQVIVAPIKILGGSGGQVRVWAVLEGHTAS
jgi:kynurenine formamidase